MILSAAQQAIVDRMSRGARLAWLSKTGKYQLVDDTIVRTVDPRTVEQLIKASCIQRDPLGVCRLVQSHT